MKTKNIIFDEEEKIEDDRIVKILKKYVYLREEKYYQIIARWISECANK